MWARLTNKRDRSLVIGLVLIIASVLIYTQARCGV
jgi:hypothetical protein